VAAAEVAAALPRAVVAVTIAAARLHPAVDTVLDVMVVEAAARHPAATAVVGTTASAPDPLADPLHLLEVDVTLWKMTVLLKSRHCEYSRFDN